MSKDLVTVATWNVNSLRARLEKVVSWLESHGPDVLCMQETKLKDEAFAPVAARLEKLGYESLHWGQGQWNGVAIASRLEVRGCLRGFDGQETDFPSATEARLLTARLDPFWLVCVYVPNGREVGSPFYEDKLAFLDALAEHVRRLKQAGPVVVCGDFNVAPDSRDVWDEEALAGSTHITEAERDRIRALGALGFKDAFRIVSPQAEGVFSWWDYRQGAFHKNQGMRIDLVLVSEDLAKAVRDCRIDREARKNPTPSDHAPVLCTLDLGTGLS